MAKMLYVWKFKTSTFWNTKVTVELLFKHPKVYFQRAQLDTFKNIYAPVLYHVVIPANETLYTCVRTVWLSWKNFLFYSIHLFALPFPLSTLIIHSFTFVILRILYQWNHTACNLLRLMVFTKYKALEVHSDCCMCQ